MVKTWVALLMIGGLLCPPAEAFYRPSTAAPNPLITFPSQALSAMALDFPQKLRHQFAGAPWLSKWAPQTQHEPLDSMLCVGAVRMRESTIAALVTFLTRSLSLVGGVLSVLTVISFTQTVMAAPPSVRGYHDGHARIHPYHQLSWAAGAGSPPAFSEGSSSRIRPSSFLSSHKSEISALWERGERDRSFLSTLWPAGSGAIARWQQSMVHP